MASYEEWLFAGTLDDAGFWTIELTRDTIVWTLVAGSVLVVNFGEAAKPGCVRARLRESVIFVAVLEYLVGLSSFPLIVDFLLQPILLAIVAAPFIAATERERHEWSRRSPNLLALFLAASLVHTALDLFAQPTVDLAARGRAMAWPTMLAWAAFPSCSPSRWWPVTKGRSPSWGGPGGGSTSRGRPQVVAGVALAFLLLPAAGGASVSALNVDVKSQSESQIAGGTSRQLMLPIGRFA